jgi:hypothetical protein
MKEELGEGLYGHELYVWLRMEMIFNARDIYPRPVWAGPSSAMVKENLEFSVDGSELAFGHI